MLYGTCYLLVPPVTVPQYITIYLLGVAMKCNEPKFLIACRCIGTTTSCEAHMVGPLFIMVPYNLFNT